MAGQRRLLDFDPATGVETWHTYDHHTRETTIETVQDVKPYLEINKAQLNRDAGGAAGLNDTSRRQIADSWWHVARIPIGVQYKWLKEEGIDIHNKDHWPRVRAKLNDPEWKYLRTNPGRV